MFVSQKIFILSPIPPQPTGTATYLSFLLRDLRKSYPRTNIQIVVDDRQFEVDPPSIFMGLEVIRYGNFVPDPHDVVCLFIANNIYHSFCMDELVRGRSRNICCFIHDVQICMLMMEMCRIRKFGFDDDILRNSIGGQFDKIEGTFVKWFEGQTVPNIAQYVTGCLGHVINHSKIIAVHSYYAAFKLQLEFARPKRIQRLLIMQHPKADLPAHPASQPGSDQFIIGVFGWLSKSKRPHLIFDVFHIFMSQLTHQERRRVKLRLVGRAIPHDFDVASAIEMHTFRDCIEYHDYVPKEQFEHLMFECALLVNLRFPSCGETSGTLNHAETYNIPTVATAYQSFYEENATYKISVDPKLETTQLLEAFTDAFQSRRNVRSRLEDRSGLKPKLNAAQVFSYICEDMGRSLVA